MPAPDVGFHGTSHESLPEADYDFSCKSENPPQRPEVVVDIKQDLPSVESLIDIIAPDNDFQEILQDESGADTIEQWVRLPLTQVEQYVNKDGPSDITRTAKVQFPITWGDVDIIRFIDGFNSHNPLSFQRPPFDECRIYFWDHEQEAYDIVQYGYVGGVGSASDDGVGKFWVYDPADLMKGVSVSKSWAEPTFRTVMNFVVRGTDQRGEDVGIENRSIFDDVEFTILGFADVIASYEQSIRDPLSEQWKRGPMQIQDSDIFPDGSSQTIDEFLDKEAADQKRFQANKHNMVDMMDWLTNMVDGRWWFEPRDDGILLVLDATSYKPGKQKGEHHRRYFVDQTARSKWENVQQMALRENISDALGLQSVSGDALPDGIENAVEGFTDIDIEGEDFEFDITIDPTGIEDQFLPPHKYSVFTDVTTLNNDALTDIKPFNSIKLIGEATTYRQRYGEYGVVFESMTTEQERELEKRALEDFQNFEEASAPGGYTEQYPHVELTYKPLIERAGGYKYSPSTIESDKVYVFEAVQQARQEFRTYIEEETEGKIQIRGEPHILPHDYFVGLPVCDETYRTNTAPINWEVNAVKHTRKADEYYTTQLGVSLAVYDRFIETEGTYKQA